MEQRSAGILTAYEHAGTGETPALLSLPWRHNSQALDELADQLAAVQDRLPELLALSLRQPALPAQLYRTILTFLAGAPSPEEIMAFAPPPA